MEKGNNSDMIGGVVLAGLLFLGAGIGMMFDQLKIGGAIGLGLGLLAMGLIRAKYLGKGE